jgi:hypothetical protein
MSAASGLLRPVLLQQDALGMVKGASPAQIIATVCHLQEPSTFLLDQQGCYSPADQLVPFFDLDPVWFAHTCIVRQFLSDANAFVVKLTVD